MGWLRVSALSRLGYADASRQGAPAGKLLRPGLRELGRRRVAIHPARREQARNFRRSYEAIWRHSDVLMECGQDDFVGARKLSKASPSAHILEKHPPDCYLP